jgi:hypothetical protein
MALTQYFDPVSNELFNVSETNLEKFKLDYPEAYVFGQQQEQQQEDFQQGTTMTDAVDVPQTQIASANVKENQDTGLNLEATSSESQDLSYYKKNRSGNKEAREKLRQRRLEKKRKELELNEDQSNAIIDIQNNIKTIIDNNYYIDYFKDRSSAPTSIDEILNDENVSDKIKDEAVSMYIKRNPTKEKTLKTFLGYDRLDELNISPFAVSHYAKKQIQKLAAKEQEQVQLEKSNITIEAQDRGDYKYTFSAWSNNHVQTFGSLDKNISQVNGKIREYRSVLENKSSSQDQITEAQKQIAKLENQATDLLARKDEDLTFFFDLSTGRRVDPIEAKKIPTAKDKTAELTAEQKRLAALRETDEAVLETEYYAHLYDYNNHIRLGNQTIDYNPNGSTAGFQSINLSKTGYKQEFIDGKQVFKGVKIKDLLPYLDQKDVKLKDFTTEEGITLDVEGALKDYRLQAPELELKHEAFKNVWHLNIDPASIRKSAATTFTRFFETASEGTIGKSKTESLFGTSTVKELDEINNLLTNAGVELTDAQKENFERSYALEIVENVGYFAPELAKFATVNAIAGPVLSGSKIIQGLARSKKAFDRLKYHGIMAAMEEAKFEVVTGGEALTGGGAGFYGGGMLSRKLIPFRFKGNLARFNPTLEKVVLAGPGMAIGSEGALMLEAVADHLEGDKKFSDALKENYGDLDQASRRLIINNFVGTFIGGTHIKLKTDFKSIKAKEKLVRDYEVKENELLKEYENQDTSDFRKQQIEKEVQDNRQLQFSLQREINVANKDFIGRDVKTLAADRDQAQQIISNPESTKSQIAEANRTIKNTTAAIETTRRRVEKSFLNLRESKALGEFDFKIQEGTEGFNNTSNKAEFVSVNGKRTLMIDILQYRQGIQAHEVTHLLLNELFKNSPDVASKLKFQINDFINEKIKDSNLSETELGDLENQIDLKYKKKNQRPEEYIANLTELLQNPTYRRVLIDNGVFNGIRKRFLNILNVNKVKSKDMILEDNNINMAQGLVNFLGSFGRNVEKGRNVTKQVQGFKNIRIDGERALDIAARDKSTTSGEFGSKDLLQSIDQLVPAEVKSKADFDKFIRNEITAKPIADALQPGGSINNYIRSRQTSKAEGDKMIEEVTMRVFNYDPAAVRKTGSQEPVTFGEAIFANTRFASMVAKKKLFKEAEKTNQQDSIDSDVARQLEGGLSAEKTLEAEPGRRAKLESVDPRAFEISNVDVIGTQAMYNAGKINKNQIGKSVSEKTLSSEKIQEAVKEDYKGFDFSKGKYKTVRIGKRTANVLAEHYGITNKKGEPLGEWFTSPARTLTQRSIEGLRRLRADLFKNSDIVLRSLADVKTPSGATGIPGNIKKLFYTENAKGELVLRKNITSKDIREVLKEPEGKLYRDSDVTTIKGLTELTFRAFTNKTVRESIPEAAEFKPQIAEGKNIFLAAKELKKSVKEVKETIEDKRVKDYFDKITKNLEGDSFLTEINYIKDQAEKLGISDGEVVANLFTTDVNYNQLNKTLKLEPSSAKIISSKANEAEAKKLNKFFIERLVPEGEKFENLPTKVKQVIVDAIGFGDRRITLGGKVSSYKEYRNELVSKLEKEGRDTTIDKRGSVKNATYSDLLEVIYGKDVLTGKGSKIKNYEKQGFSKAEAKEKTLEDFNSVFAPRDWGKFARDVATIVEKKGITQEQAKKQVENLLSAEGKTIQETQKANADLLNNSYNVLADYIVENPNKKSLSQVSKFLQSQTNRATGIFKGLVNPTSFTMKPEKGTTKNQNKKMHNEHLVELFNANKNFINLLDSFMKGRITKSQLKSRIKFNTESLEQAVISERMRVEKDASGAAVRDFANPLTFLGKDAGNQVIIGERFLDSGKRFTGLSMAEFVVENLSQSQVQQIARTKLSELNAEGVMVKQRVDNKSSYDKASANNSNKLPSSLVFASKQNNGKVLQELSTLDKALKKAGNPKAPVKKIRVFDFDDTLARSNSQVLYEMPNGKKGKLNATQFAEKAGQLESQGAVFDFSEFSKIVDGKKGPVFKAIENIVAKRGAEDVFILTARPADAAGPIKQFMDALGVKLPIENIVGLGDGKAQAKARWITGKAAEGYNDFFFVDDAYKNVKAVKEALEVFDVKSKTQQAKVAFASKDLSKEFNDIIEAKTGIGSEKEYSRVKAEVAGAGKGKFKFFIPPSAEDFVGLLYPTLGKGKLGDAQMAWYKQHLINPYARAMNNISSERIAMVSDYRSLKKQLGIVPKNLRKKIEGEPYTVEQAVRSYIWNKQGMEIPGMSKADLKTLVDYISSKPELQAFAEQLVAIQKGDKYVSPKEGWVAGSITTDLIEGLNSGKRAKHLEYWKQNVDQIFSEKNLNKLEAAYGKKYRTALEGMLKRMETGRNRSYAQDSLTGRFMDWVNGSVGTIMFFNTRSAVLQTISSINFLNWSDNNPLAAAKAFGNQKQYWKDFMYIMNSKFLQERRGGLRINVNESDIAETAKKGGAKAVVAKILEKGYLPTQYADSFAIASGGATFYRNRVKKYVKQGLDIQAAEKKAFEDFREITEESQQSARPDRISAQQASPLGRSVLNFQNTPMQYARLMKKAASDLANRRGNDKENISKLIYYGTVQNLIFNALQQGVFAIGFGGVDDEEAKEQKYFDTANAMVDSVLKGTGLAGNVVAVGKNAIIRIIEEEQKDRPKLEKVGYELTRISPPISSKLSRINQAARSYQWEKEDMATMGFNIENPAYLASANVISATTNVPVERLFRKIDNVNTAISQDLQTWERLALLGGWPDWQIGVEEPAPKVVNKSNDQGKSRVVKRTKVKRKKVKR